MQAIGYMRSPLAKNGSPRQGNLGSVRGVVHISSGTGNNEEHALEGLEAFSHVWLVFVFHKNRGGNVLRNKIRPPKIEGKKGLFATRTPHRPNPIGLTLAKIDRIEGTKLCVSDIDLIDGTPILDIKPYIDTFDSAPNSHVPGWLPPPEKPPLFDLQWSNHALTQLAETPLNFYRQNELDMFQKTVAELLALNPRSKYWAHTYGDYYYIKFDRIVIHMTFQGGDLSAVVDRIEVEDDLIIP